MKEPKKVKGLTLRIKSKEKFISKDGRFTVVNIGDKAITVVIQDKEFKKDKEEK